MTDDRMDALLHEVGGRWRDAHPDAADVTEPRTTSRRRRRPGLFLSAATVAAALVAGLVVVIVAVGRHDPTPPANSGLTGTVWRQTVNGRPAPSGGVLQISAKGRLVAADECGVVGVTVHQDRGQLFPTGFETRPFDCVDRTGPGLGDALTELLATFPSYRVTDDHLRIGNGADRRDFVAAPGLPAPTLDVPSVAEARWRLTGVRNASGTDVSTPAGVQFRLADNRLTTSDGCNAIAADGAVDGSSLALKNVTRTERGCRSGADAAAVIDAVFDGAITHRVVGNQLTLAATGAGTLAYRWEPDDAAATDPARLVGRFRLTSVSGQPADGGLQVRFGDGTVMRTDPCGSARSGRTVLAPGALRVVGSGTSKYVGCAAAPAPDASQALDRVLFGGPAFYRFDGTKLVVRSAADPSTVLVLAGGATSAPGTSLSLLGTWTLTEVQVDRGNSGGGTGSEDLGVTVTFDNGRFRLTGTCGSPSGTYEQVGDQVRFLTGGQDFCVSGGVGRQVQPLFLRGSTVRWAVDEPRLTLTRGATSLTFTRR